MVLLLVIVKAKTNIDNLLSKWQDELANSLKRRHYGFFHFCLVGLGHLSGPFRRTVDGGEISESPSPAAWQFRAGGWHPADGILVPSLGDRNRCHTDGGGHAGVCANHDCLGLVTPLAFPERQCVQRAQKMTSLSSLGTFFLQTIICLKG